MWSWYKGEYVMPLIKEVNFDVGDHILPVYKNGNINMVIRGEPRNTECAKAKAITQNGIEDLCVYCKKMVERFVEDSKRCRFAFDKKSVSGYGWTTDSLTSLVSTTEVPIYVLLPTCDARLDITKLDFNPKRIRANVRHLAGHASEFYDNVIDSVHIHFYATGHISEYARTKDAFIRKINKLHDKLSKLDDRDFAAKLLDMSI